MSQPVPPLAEAANGASEAADSASLDAAAGCSSAEKASAASGGTGRPLLHHLGFIGMWTKLRPHVHEFLTAVSGMYELYVYTMGSRAYAAEMVRLLDPDGSLGLHGRDRVIGKEDATDAHTKALDVILDSDAMTLITDDSPGVWPQQANQLLVPRRYHFFPSSAARDTSLPAGYRCVLARAQDEQVCEWAGGFAGAGRWAGGQVGRWARGPRAGGRGVGHTCDGAARPLVGIASRHGIPKHTASGTPSLGSPPLRRSSSQPPPARVSTVRGAFACPRAPTGGRWAAGRFDGRPHTHPRPLL